MASAADMAVKAPAPYAIPYSWTGLYAGVHAGAGWGTVESNVDLGGFTLPISSHEINGPLAGLQIGYNYQMGWALIGLEAGAMHVQGTINGSGERTGNCNLTSVIPNLVPVPFNSAARCLVN